MHNFSTSLTDFQHICTHQFASSLKESELNFLFVLARSQTRPLPSTLSCADLRLLSALFKGSNMKIRSRNVCTIICVVHNFTIVVSLMVILWAAVWRRAPSIYNSLWQPSSPFCSNGLRCPNNTLSSQAGPSVSQYYAVLTGRAFGVPIIRCPHRQGLRSPNTMLPSQAGLPESQ